MLSVMWKSVVFLSVVRSLWFLFELGAMWFLAGMDGVFSTFDGHFDGFVDALIGMTAYAIGFSWLLAKLSDFQPLEIGRSHELNSSSPTTEDSRIQESVSDSLTQEDLYATGLDYEL